ncbi:hypothetical protein TWF730_010074 [Orbilia blumenaviensis]|uniref:Uncharacterized protein n=1 Tax=Orbilia blumenaviensis TaxID=1796055 RepID=A0AAV9UTW2_9PEZI
MPTLHFDLPYPIDKTPPSPIKISTTTLTLTSSTTSTLTTLLTTTLSIDIIHLEATGSPSLHPVNAHVPGLNPMSQYITSSANETILTNAIFSHPAIITWASLFCSFLLFAGLVFALQKIMRRVRARRWIRKTVQDLSTSTPNTECTKDETTAKDEKWDGNGDKKVHFENTRAYRGCEFINGSDLSLRANEGVDERSGSWSKRRDKRFSQGGIGRKKRLELPP